MATRWPCCRPCRADDPEGHGRVGHTGTIDAVTSPLAKVSDPAYLADLESDDLETVRAKRQECQDIENALSYVRRLLHGRLDIVRSELERRRAGAEPADLDSIIDRLPGLLSEGSRSDTLPRPPQDLAPDPLADELVGELDAAFPASRLAGLPELSLDELGELAAALTAYEREISGGRTALHEVIDTLSEEIIRRYQEGAASVDSLLQ